MDNFTINVAATRLGAACLGAHSAWATVVAPGADHALGRNAVLAAGAPDARRAALRQIPAMSAQTNQLPQFESVTAEPLSTTVKVTRKQTNHVHKTRINAGGYGAMGPHPEREHLA